MSNDLTGSVPGQCEEAWRTEAEARAEQAKRFTKLLLTSELPRWRRLREAIRGTGVDTQDAAVADLHIEDHRQEFGLIRVRDGRAFLFEFEYFETADGEKIDSPDDAWVSRFKALSPGEEKRYREPLSWAQPIFDEPSQ